ncbi:MAG: RSP_7527 family protein [Minwuia sp.]|uniref:RSP_7527 family protein n=1 Tax=Minwuia sp. TaxID=2493630 RepID=UPI003A8A8DF7
MEYRSYDINKINDLNRTVIEDQVQLDVAMANVDYYIRRGKAERAQTTLAGLRSVRRAISGLFA